VRLRRCTELLQNIKALKLFAWEEILAERVKEIRQRQLRCMLKAAVLKALTSQFKTFSIHTVLYIPFVVTLQGMYGYGYTGLAC